MKEHAQKQFNRVQISSKDFEEALDYLDQIGKVDSAPINRALLVAAIITYSRPFTSNDKGKAEEASGKLPIDPKKTVNPNAYSLHNKILKLRNEAVAHSEYGRNPSARTYSADNSFAIQYTRFDPLTENIDIEQFRLLLISMKRGCIAKLSQLNGKF